MSEKERGSTRREDENDDRRNGHRREGHRRKENLLVELEQRTKLDQRINYQRLSTRRDESDRRI